MVSVKKHCPTGPMLSFLALSQQACEALQSVVCISSAKTPQRAMTRGVQARS